MAQWLTCPMPRLPTADLQPPPASTPLGDLPVLFYFFQGLWHKHGTPKGSQDPHVPTSLLRTQWRPLWVTPTTLSKVELGQRQVGLQGAAANTISFEALDPDEGLEPWGVACPREILSGSTRMSGRGAGVLGRCPMVPAVLDVAASGRGGGGVGWGR